MVLTRAPKKQSLSAVFSATSEKHAPRSPAKRCTLTGALGTRLQMMWREMATVPHVLRLLLCVATKAELGGAVWYTRYPRTPPRLGRRDQLDRFRALFAVRAACCWKTKKKRTALSHAARVESVAIAQLPGSIAAPVIETRSQKRRTHRATQKSRHAMENHDDNNQKRTQRYLRGAGSRMGPKTQRCINPKQRWALAVLLWRRGGEGSTKEYSE